MTDGQDQSIAARLAEAVKDSFTLEGEIGRGGMGVVFSAQDLNLQRRVAIKVLPPDLAFREDIRQRFEQEAQVAARLQHPHIVPIHAVGSNGNLVYFIMGFVDGESLGQRLRRRKQLPVEEARRIMKETADALGMAHSQGIIHRDIKPDNILLEGTRRRVMVTDFGIAKALTESGSGLTGTGVAIGTPTYMSPEQAAGEGKIDARSDLYSLGVVAYEMITGSPPFKAPTVPGILVKQITEPAPDILKRRPECPNELASTIHRALEKDPEDRWPTAEALRRALESRSSGPYKPRRSSAPRRSSTSRLPSRDSTSRRGRLESKRPPPDREGKRDREVGAKSRSKNREALARRKRGQETPEKQKDESGETKIVRTFRGQFASYVSVNGCLMLINVMTGLGDPWFLIPAGIWGIGIASSYGKLWSAGYSWRDVIYRPPAADSIASGGATFAAARKVLKMPEPSTEEFGQLVGQMRQMQKDRDAIVQIHGKLDAAEKGMLPDVIETVDRLYKRAVELCTTLQQMDEGIETSVLSDLEKRIDRARTEAAGDDDSEAARHLSLLERQHSSLKELASRKNSVEDRFQSCVLAVQTMRFDMLRLRSAGVESVLSDLTRATQQAQALSIDINAAIGAAGEIREALGKPTES